MIVVDRDLGYRAFMTRIRGGDLDVSVGVLEGDGSNPHDDTYTIAEIAAIHEFGTEDGRVPQRSWLRGWADERKAEINAAQKAAAIAVLKGRKARVALEAMGSLFVDQIKDRIREHIAPELKQSTKDRKGSSTPLIDRGTFISSIKSEVRRRVF